jgi:hypothetical protein
VALVAPVRVRAVQPAAAAPVVPAALAARVPDPLLQTDARIALSRQSMSPQYLFFLFFLLSPLFPVV